MASPDPRMKAQAMAIGKNLPLIRWLLGHARDVPAIIDAANGVINATGIDQKWIAIKAAGDYLVPMALELQDLLANRVGAKIGDVKDLYEHEAVKLNPAILTTIIANLDKIILIIQMILGLFQEDN